MEHSIFNTAPDEVPVLQADAEEQLLGWVKNTNEEYHAGPGLGSTQLKAVIECPALYFQNHVLKKTKPTPAMAFGSLCHSAILENGDFLKGYKVIPDFGDMKSSTNRAKRDAWMMDLPKGAVAITEKEFDQVKGMAEAILEHPDARALLSNGVPEMSGYARDPETGVLLKIRPDFRRHDRIMVDLKSTKDASAKAFQRQAYDLGYFISAGMYMFVGDLICEEKHDEFAFIAVEKEPPYLVNVFRADEEFLSEGKKRMRRGIEIFKECKEAQEKGQPDAAQKAWYGYKGITNLILPPWAFYDA